jgi:hypothetical protein
MAVKPLVRTLAEFVRPVTGCVLVALAATLLCGCGAGTPDPATEATDPAKAPRGGDMISTQMRAGQRATQAVDKANAVREQQMKELE